MPERIQKLFTFVSPAPSHSPYSAPRNCSKTIPEKISRVSRASRFYYTILMRIYFFTVSYKDSVFYEFQRCNKIIHAPNIKDAINTLKKELFPDTNKLIIENIYSEEE